MSFGIGNDNTLPGVGVGFGDVEPVPGAPPIGPVDPPCPKPGIGPVDTTEIPAVGAGDGDVCGIIPGAVRPIAVVPDMIAVPQFHPRRSTHPINGS